MFGITVLKLWHKKWMNLCLILGCTLLIATTVSFPMYQAAAYDRMLRDEFDHFYAKEGSWPTGAEMTTVSKKDKTGAAISKLETFQNGFAQTLGVTEKEKIRLYTHSRMDLHSEMNRPDAGTLSLRLGAMSDLPEHVKLLAGEIYSGEPSGDGVIDIVVTQGCLTAQGLLVGETLRFDAMKDAQGNPIRLRVTGVIAPRSMTDIYWQTDPEELSDVLLMDMDLFSAMFTGENAGKYTLTCKYDMLFEYADLRAPQVAYLQAQTDYLTTASSYRSVLKLFDYPEILKEYAQKRERIFATLMILQIPVLVMLAAFLFMISGQMYEMERNEISVIKSRGSSRAQIFRLYLYQCGILTIVGALLGIPLGRVFARVLGATSSFLQFDSSRLSEVSFTRECAFYAAGAMLVTLGSMTLPAIRHSRVSIVHLKAQKAMRKKTWWEKVYLDIILIGVSIYGYYSFHRDAQKLSEHVLSGKGLDPLLYVSSSVFILGCGLLFLRLQPLFVRLLLAISGKVLRPAIYVSLRESVRNSRKQQLIMLFLILTVSLGMYHANVASTIMANAEENARYLDGADVILREVWTEKVDEEGRSTGQFVEPDYAKYASMPGVDGYTRVFYDDKAAAVTSGGNSRQAVTLMGIHTREFGSETAVPGAFLPRPYRQYLNDLAVVSDGFLASMDFHTKLGFEVGDSVTVLNRYGGSTTGKIVAFFDYFPGYAPSVVEIGPDGSAFRSDRFLLVGHYASFVREWGTLPYEVWVDRTEGADDAAFYDWIEEKNLRLTKFTDRDRDVEDAMTDPLLQGTGGVLSMGFVVTILLCAVGYLIYWVMSIRERELTFGVLRACGLHKRELFTMLLIEQLFSGGLSIAAGIGIGKGASKLFVPILQQAYAAANQAIPMQVVANAAALDRLYVVLALVMTVSLLVLVLLLFRMNVSKALKLGEE